MKNRFKIFKEKLPLTVLIYENGTYTEYGDNRIFKTIEEFRKSKYFPDYYNPVVLDLFEQKL